jgi:2-oxoacid:acceptor oxidoreductase delta subunit (pyruvate/2-ketoisovalerate family)
MKKNLNVLPGTSIKNKTGAWRTARAVIDINKCIGCTLCHKICPEACIDMIAIDTKQKASVDYDFCKGCGLCVRECPVKAISLVPENK